MKKCWVSVGISYKKPEIGFKQNVPMTLTYVPMTYEERMLYDATKNEETNFRKTVAVLVSNGFDSDVFVSNNGHGA